MFLISIISPVQSVQIMIEQRKLEQEKERKMIFVDELSVMR